MNNTEALQELQEKVEPGDLSIETITDAPTDEGEWDIPQVSTSLIKLEVYYDPITEGYGISAAAEQELSEVVFEEIAWCLKVWEHAVRQRIQGRNQ